MNSELTAPLLSVSFDELLNTRHQLDDFSCLPQNDQNNLLAGGYRSKKRGRGIDFDQVRPYLPGDDVRNIDWKVTAKAGKAHTKLFFEEKERPIFIIVDQSDALFFTTTTQLKSTLSARLGAMLCWWSYVHQDRLSGIVFNSQQIDRIPPRLSKKNVFHYLHAISALNQNMIAQIDNPEVKSPKAKNPDPFYAALKEARSMIKSGALIIVICDERALNETSCSILKQFSLKNELVFMPIFDPLDRALPKASGLMFQQGHKTQLINGLDEKTQQRYHEKVQQRLTLWHSLVKESKAHYYPISTQHDIAAQLLNDFNSKENHDGSK